MVFSMSNSEERVAVENVAGEIIRQSFLVKAPSRPGKRTCRERPGRRDAGGSDRIRIGLYGCEAFRDPARVILTQE